MFDVFDVPLHLQSDDVSLTNCLIYTVGLSSLFFFKTTRTPVTHEALICTTSHHSFQALNSNCTTHSWDQRECARVGLLKPNSTLNQNSYTLFLWSKTRVCRHKQLSNKVWRHKVKAQMCDTNNCKIYDPLALHMLDFSWAKGAISVQTVIKRHMCRYTCQTTPTTISVHEIMIGFVQDVTHTQTHIPFYICRVTYSSTHFNSHFNSTHLQNTHAHLHTHTGWHADGVL